MALFTKEPGRPLVITEEGRALLSQHVSDLDGKVFVFYDSMPSEVSTAAMARVSRTADTLLVVLLKEFVDRLMDVPKHNRDLGKEQELLRKIITEYGDDSVQQLFNVRLVVNDSSKILAKILERGRIGIAYIETSSRYVFLDEKVWKIGEEEPQFRYYTPKEFSDTHSMFYKSWMNVLFENYSKVVRQLVKHVTKTLDLPSEDIDAAMRNSIRAKACDFARGMLPVSTTTTVTISGNAQAVESLIMHLIANELDEARQTGYDMLREVRKVAPVFFERADDPKKGGRTSVYLAETKKDFKTTASLFGKPYQQTETVVLKKHYPQKEEQFLQGLIFAAGYQPLDEGTNSEILSQLLDSFVGDRTDRRQKPGRQFEEVWYTFVIRCSFAAFQDLQRHRIVNNLDWHTLSPDTDYDVPELVKEAGLQHLYEQNFKISRACHTEFAKDYPPEVLQYLTLFGHKVNWTITVNLRELMHIVELRTIPEGHAEYREVCRLMFESVKAVHPQLAATMKFVNCEKDRELNRLEAETRKAEKLKRQQQ